MPHVLWIVPFLCTSHLHPQQDFVFQIASFGSITHCKCQGLVFHGIVHVSLLCVRDAQVGGSFQCAAVTGHIKALHGEGAVGPVEAHSLQRLRHKQKNKSYQNSCCVGQSARDNAVVDITDCKHTTCISEYIPSSRLIWQIVTCR